MSRAQAGDRAAIEALLQRSLPELRRWAHGRLPVRARGSLDTADLVQEAVLHTLRRLHLFDPRHVGAMQAYLRAAVINRIRDEVRKVIRRPDLVELDEQQPGDTASPMEAAMAAESYQRYRRALDQLDRRDREVIVARIEVQWSFADIARRFGMPTVDAARMAIARAMRRLRAGMRA